MRSGSNRRVVLTARPRDIPTEEHFTLETVEVGEPAVGQVLVRNIYLSVEPAMRGWVSSESNYSEPVQIGSVMRSPAAGRVEESRHPDFRPGDYVTGMFGWQEYAIVDGAEIERPVTETALPLSASLGVLGLTGMVAYFGLREVGQPRPGETVVVSTAAGAVGSCVGQIAKIMGGRTVGIAGGSAKVRLCVEQFGFDAAIDYKDGDLTTALAEACPDGIDVYYDNTAGSISDVVLAQLRVGARVVVCGTAAIPVWTPWPLGPRVERRLLVTRARMQGVIATDYSARFPEARRDLAQWIREGRLRYREDILDGIERAPDAIAGLYRGENLGKRLIRVADDEEPSV